MESFAPEPRTWPDKSSALTAKAAPLGKNGLPLRVELLEWGAGARPRLSRRQVELGVHLGTAAGWPDAPGHPKPNAGAPARGSMAPATDAAWRVSDNAQMLLGFKVRVEQSAAMVERPATQLAASGIGSEPAFAADPGGDATAVDHAGAAITGHSGWEWVAPWRGIAERSRLTRFCHIGMRSCVTSETLGHLS